MGYNKLSCQKYREKNKEILKLKSREYYRKNKEKETLRTKKWFKENPEKIKEYNNSDDRKKYLKEYNKNNKEKIKKYSDEWYQNNILKISERNRLLHQNKRSEIIYYYSNGTMKCNKCGENIYEFLEIDHINGGGRQHRLRTHHKLIDDIIKDGFLEEYQILCSNCNIKKLKKYNDLNKDKYKYQKLYNQRLKSKVISYYSPEIKCDCCNENDIDVLSIDHINGGGNNHRKDIGNNIYKWLIDNNYPDGYRVLCHNCNQSYGHRGYCPHQLIYQ